jgi:hypothetical protein
MVASRPSRALACPPWEAVKWLADESLDNAIIRGLLRLRGLLRQVPTLDILRAQDIPEVAGQDDAVLLSFAIVENRVVVTHDVSTMIPAMYRIRCRWAPLWKTS